MHLWFCHHYKGHSVHLIILSLGTLKALLWRLLVLFWVCLSKWINILEQFQFQNETILELKLLQIDISWIALGAIVSTLMLFSTLCSWSSKTTVISFTIKVLAFLILRSVETRMFQNEDLAKRQTTISFSSTPPRPVFRLCCNFWTHVRIGSKISLFASNVSQ